MNHNHPLPIILAAILTLTISGVLVSSLPAKAATKYYYQAPPMLNAYSINNKGEVVGANSRACRWTPQTGLCELGFETNSGARAINNNGQIVGYYEKDGQYHAFFLSEAGGITDLGSLGGGRSFAYSINDFCQVVGTSTYSTDPGNYWHAFLWSLSQGMQDLGIPTDNMLFDSAFAVNNFGVIVGSAVLLGEGKSVAVRWTQTKGVERLDNVPLGDGPDTFARAVNNHGQIVGISTNFPLDPFGFFWENGTYTNLGNNSAALSINNYGQVVGYSGDSAFIWTAAEGTKDLNGLVVNLPPGVTLVEATGINDLGQIVGQSNVGAFLLTPTNALPSVNTHWYNWATTFSTYGQLIKKYGVVRDGVWWEDLEKSDYTTEANWANAAWSYPHDLTLPNCNQTVTYQSGYDNLTKKFQDLDSPGLLMMLNTTNKYIVADPNNITYTQYYDYVSHVVSRYNKSSPSVMPGLTKSVIFYEVGNEPDNSTLNGGLTLSNYVNNRLIPAYRAAKQANPDSRILNAGLYLGGDNGFDTTYLDNMLNLLKQNGGESNNYYMDILAIHYYYHPQDPEYFLANIEKVRQIMSKYNISSKPLWITEYGMATKSDAGGQIREKDQASILLRFNCLMKFSNIDNSIIYNLKDVNSNNPTWENTYGLYKVSCQQSGEQITPKEAVQVLDTFYKMTNGLNNITINSIDERNSGIYRLTFTNGTKYVNVIWYTKMDGTGVNPDHASETATIKVAMEGPTGALSDMSGNILIDKLYSGTSIPIGEQPVYIESQKRVSVNSIIPALHLLLSN